MSAPDIVARKLEKWEIQYIVKLVFPELEYNRVGIPLD